ncbi:ABC transporter permease [Actinoplanes sp. NPDC049265]|uniref:ABC transporter permease n=1 Tax=Actinoplanes sp. NPDC049265 TaxID=3363902 RepID=UPI00371EA472
MTAIAATRPGDVNNFATYVSFGLAYVLGHGATALAQGTNPLVAMPGWLPQAILIAGLAAGSVAATLAAARAQRGADRSDRLAGQLLGLSWIVGFGALFLALAALSLSPTAADLRTVLMPAGSGLVVGLLYFGEGAARRNVLHWGLGVWLALISAAGLFLGSAGLFWVLALAGGGGYAAAALLERRRRAGTYSDAGPAEPVRDSRVWN